MSIFGNVPYVSFFCEYYGWLSLIVFHDFLFSEQLFSTMFLVTVVLMIIIGLLHICINTVMFLDSSFL